MKLLVFSDSHGVLDTMIWAVEHYRPDRVLHLGDCCADFTDLRQRFPEIPMDGVPGNCDYGVQDAPTRFLELEGVRIMMTHGHRYGVKSGYLRIVYAAREQQADILLFGHTHRAECFREGALWVMNPGAAGTGCFGIITLTQENAECVLMRQDGKERCDAVNN